MKRGEGIGMAGSSGDGQRNSGGDIQREGQDRQAPLLM